MKFIVYKFSILLGITLGLFQGTGFAAIDDLKFIEACQRAFTQSNWKPARFLLADVHPEDLRTLSEAVARVVHESYAVVPATQNPIIEAFFSKARVPLPQMPGAITAEALMDGYTYQDSLGGNPWIVKAGNFLGVRGIVFSTPDSSLESRQFLTFMDVLRKGELNWLQGDQVALAMHIQSGPQEEAKNFWIFDCRRFYKRHYLTRKTHPYRDIPRQFRDFFLKVYREHFDFTEEEFLSLLKISEITESRSILFLQTKNSFADVNAKGDIIPLVPFAHIPGERPDPVTLDIESGAMMVISKSAEEPLPHEFFVQDTLKDNDYTFPREPGEETAEIVRYLVTSNGVKKVSMRMVQYFATVAMGLGIPTLTAFASDSAHERLFKQYGFQVVASPQEKKPEENSDSGLNSLKKPKHYSVLKISTETLLENILRKDFPAGSLDSDQEEKDLAIGAGLEQTGLYFLMVLRDLAKILDFGS
jgi:hypothetical protein